MPDVTRPDGLVCDHCGDEAIQFNPPAWPGHFWHLSDGEGDRCESCGFPGHVTIDDDGEPEDYSCRWMINDWDEGLKCQRPACEECVG